MRIFAILLLAGLVSCTTNSHVEPIPGSITYGGQPRIKLTKSPIGSTFTNDFIMSDGRRAFETYRIEQDRSLTLLNREIVSDLPEN